MEKKNEINKKTMEYLFFDGFLLFDLIQQMMIITKIVSSALIITRSQNNQLV